jgi:hypothetical protein
MEIALLMFVNLKMNNQGDLLWYCFDATMQTLRLKNPDIKMANILSMLKLWLPENYYATKTIYFLEDYPTGVKFSPEAMFGMHDVLDVLRVFHNKRDLLYPPNKEAPMFPSEMM